MCVIIYEHLFPTSLFNSSPFPATWTFLFSLSVISFLFLLLLLPPSPPSSSSSFFYPTKSSQCCPYVHGCGLSSGAWETYSRPHPLIKKISGPSTETIHYQYLLSQDWGLQIIFPTQVGVLAGLILHGSFVGNHSLCHFQTTALHSTIPHLLALAFFLQCLS